MATNEDMIDGQPQEYGISVDELRELMELRKHEAYEVLQTKYNGVHEICKKLYTSSNEGEYLKICDSFIPGFLMLSDHLTCQT